MEEGRRRKDERSFKKAFFVDNGEGEGNAADGGGGGFCLRTTKWNEI